MDRVQDFRDIALAHVMADLVAADARVASLTDDVEIYRAMALEASAVLSTVTCERDRFREQLARLRDEFRFVRESLMRDEVAA